MKCGCFPRSIVNVCPSLTNQIQPLPEKGKGFMNGVYKLCPTGMQLTGSLNQISNNAHLKYEAKCGCFPRSIVNVCPSLTNQIQPLPEKGKGFMNGVYKLCPTGMQLTGSLNQISNNAHLKYDAKCGCFPRSIVCFYSS